MRVRTNIQMQLQTEKDTLVSKISSDGRASGKPRDGGTLHNLLKRNPADQTGRCLGPRSGKGGRGLAALGIELRQGDLYGSGRRSDRGRFKGIDKMIMIADARLHTDRIRPLRATSFDAAGGCRRSKHFVYMSILRKSNTGFANEGSHRGRHLLWSRRFFHRALTLHARQSSAVPRCPRLLCRPECTGDRRPCPPPAREKFARGSPERDLAKSAGGDIPLPREGQRETKPTTSFGDPAVSLLGYRRRCSRRSTANTCRTRPLTDEQYLELNRRRAECPTSSASSCSVGCRG